MKVVFHPAAAEEFLAAVDYYESALATLGRRFADAVQHATAVVAEHPDAGSPHPVSGVRRLLIVGFPYDVVYRRRDTGVEVIALAHHRRRPNYWRDR